MKDVEAPLWDEVERFYFGRPGSILGCLSQDEVEELAVGMPAVDVIECVGAFDGLEMTEGELVVEGKEELVSPTFVGDGIWGRPACLWKIQQTGEACRH